MAADVAVRPAWLSLEQDKLFRVVDENFTQVEKQKVYGDSNKILGNAPQDSMFEWLVLLRKQGQITNSNIVVIKDYLVEQSSNKGEIERAVEDYMKNITEERPDLTGREEEIEKISTKLRTDESAVINLYGVSGVGKTTLAKDICYRWEKESLGRSLTVDLREVKEMKFVYFRILQALEPKKTTLKNEEETVFKRVRELKNDGKPVLVLFDNSEQFAGGKDEKSKSLRTEFLSFLKRLKSPTVDKFKKLRILLTSRRQFTAAELIEDFCLKPLEKEQSGELLKSEVEQHIFEEQKTEVLKLCGGRPLLLNTVGAAVKQEGAKLKYLISKIKEGIATVKGKMVETMKPSGAEKSEDGKSAEPERAAGQKPDVDIQDFSFLRSMFFNLPSKDLQDAAVSLSLFCSPFSLKAAAGVIGVGMDKASLILESLRSYNFIITADPDARDMTYDIHPLLKAVLKGMRKEEDFKQAFENAETRFSHVFMKRALHLGKLLDKHYIDIHRIFKAEQANFELALDITAKRDYLFIPETWYHDVVMTAFLFDAMLDVKMRMKLYRSWADTAEKEGKDCLAAELRCWEALQVLDIEGSHKAHEVLKKAKASLDKADEKDTKMLKLTKAQYHFALGKVYQKLYQEPKQALEEYVKSLDNMDQRLGDTQTARCLNAIGISYQHLSEPHRAIEFFRRAYNMRKKLSGEEHLDMPVYKNQIGAVFDGQEDYDQAIQHYQSAIELEEKLKISGYESTANYYRNIANAYLQKDEYAAALEPATKAYKIRNQILGKHPETTRSLFQLGLVWKLQDKRDKALRYYKEAWEMEKSLETGHHSVVRDRIVEDLLDLYDKRKNEKKLFEEDALKFYCRIWKEEKSFKHFQFSTPNRAVVNMIIELHKSLGGRKADMKRYQEEAIGMYEKTWEERDTLPELKWDKTSPIENSVVRARGDIVIKLQFLYDELRPKNKKKLFEEDALQDYCRIWKEQKLLEQFQFSTPIRAVMNKIIELHKSLRGRKADMKSYQEEALGLYEKTWEDRDTLPELKWDKTSPVKNSVVRVRGDILEKIKELAESLSDKGKVKQFEGETLDFFKEVYFAEGSVDISEYKRPKLFKTIVGKLSKPRQKEFAEEALSFHYRQWVKLRNEKEEKYGPSIDDAISALLKICCDFGSKQRLSEYQREALAFYKELWTEKASEMDESCRKKVVQTIVKLASKLKDKATEKEYNKIKQELEKGECVAAKKEEPAREARVPEASAGAETDVEGEVEIGEEVQEEGEQEIEEVVQPAVAHEDEEVVQPAVAQELEEVVKPAGAQELEEVVQPAVAQEAEEVVQSAGEQEVQPGEEQQLEMVQPEGGQELELVEEVHEENMGGPSDDEDNYEEKTVSPQGSDCVFKKAAAHVIFLPNAVPEIKSIKCTALNPDDCRPPTAETEVLVSNVVELLPLDLTFSEDVTLALSYSATKLRGYEVVVKELKDKESNAWEELHTVNIKEDTGSSTQLEAGVPLPTVKVTIRHAGTFAAICRLASCSFDVSAKVKYLTHPKFPSLKVKIPAGAIPPENRFKVHMKVQEISAEDVNTSEGHACPALHLDVSENVTFLKPVKLSIPVTLRDGHTPPILLSKCTPRIRIFFCESGGDLGDWKDITDTLDEKPYLKKNSVVKFKVNHFSWFGIMLEWGSKVLGVLEYAASLFKPAPLPVLFRACERTSNQRLGSTTQLILICLPAHKRDELEQYKTLSQADSAKDVRPQDKSYVQLDEEGGLRAAQDMEDFCLVFKETNPFEKPLDVRVVEYRKTRLFFYGDPSRNRKLCDFSVELTPLRQDQRALDELRSIVSKNGLRIVEFNHVEGGELSVPFLEKVVQWSKSVGIIVAKNFALKEYSGTVFRVGSCYVMTCWHVVKGIFELLDTDEPCALSDHVKICFNLHEPVDGAQQHRKLEDELHEVEPLVWCNEDLDAAVLQLKEPTDHQLPSRLKSPPEKITRNSPLHLIGHSGGKHKIVNLFCKPCLPDHSDVKKLRIEKGNELLKNCPNLLNPETVLMKSSFMPGSSGSPGFDNSGNLVVMLIAGVFNDSEYVFRQGVSLKAVNESLVNSKIPGLYLGPSPPLSPAYP